MNKFFIILCGVLLLSSPALAANEFTIVLKDHKFTPAEIEVPAGQKIKLIIDNQDATPEEFESKPLHKEKIIPANSKGSIAISPLKAGEYEYVGEYNEEIAKGKIIAK